MNHRENQVGPPGPGQTGPAQPEILKNRKILKTAWIKITVYSKHELRIDILYINVNNVMSLEQDVIGSKMTGPSSSNVFLV